MKPRLANLLIAVFSLALSFFVAELITRFFLPAPQIIHIADNTPSATKNLQTIPTKTISLNEHPDEGGVYMGSATGRRLSPNRSITIENHRLSRKKVTIETNSIGYRNKEIGEKQEKRILFLGDSVTFQDYLNENETFVRQVEALAHKGGNNWETINAAVGAISLKTELAILKETGLALSPDLVVIGFYLNDFQESKGVDIIRLPWYLKTRHLKNSYFLYYLTERINQLRGVHLVKAELDIATWKKDFIKTNTFSSGFFNQSPGAFNQMILDAFNDYGAIWSDQAWMHIHPLFKEFKKLSEQHDFKLVIVAFPIYQQVYTEFLNDYPQAQLKIIADELNIPLLDTLPLLRNEAVRLRQSSTYAPDIFYQDLFYDQCHHTPEASALIAAEIYTFLTQNQF